MKILNKLFVGIIVTLQCVVCLNVCASSNVTINETNNIEHTELYNGVFFDHQTINTQYKEGIAIDRDVFSYTLKSTSTAKIATWSYANPSGYERSALTRIAENYERQHPGWIVIGGINAEGYFGTNGEITNAFIQDGDVIRKDVSNESFKELIGFYKDGSHVVKRVPQAAETMTLTDITNNLEYNITNINSYPDEGGISLITEKCLTQLDISKYKVYQAKYSLYRVSEQFPNSTLSGSNYGIFVKGLVENIVEANTLTTKTGKFYLISDNNLELSIDSQIKCEYKYTDEYKDVISMTGYMFKLIENNKVVTNDYYQDWSNLYNEGLIPTDDSFRYSDHAYTTSNRQRASIGFTSNGDVILLTANSGAGGPTQFEVAEILKNKGCNEAYQFDCGSSVTFIKRNEFGKFDILNKGQSPQSLSTGIFIVIRDPGLKLADTTRNTLTFSKNNSVFSTLVSDVSLVLNGKKYLMNEDTITINNLLEDTEYESYFEYKIRDEYDENTFHVLQTPVTKVRTDTYKHPLINFKITDIDATSFNAEIIMNSPDAELLSIKTSAGGANSNWDSTKSTKVKGLVKDTEYDVTFTYNIKEIATGNVYEGTSQIFFIKTLAYYLPSIDEFEISQKENGELIISYEINDRDNISSLYYVINNEKVKIEEKGRIKLDNLDFINQIYKVQLLLEYPDGLIESEIISTEKQVNSSNSCSFGTNIVKYLIIFSFLGILLSNINKYKNQ